MPPTHEFPSRSPSERTQRAWTCNTWSATIRSCRAVPTSSLFNRFASSAFMPPCCARPPALTGLLVNSLHRHFSPATHRRCDRTDRQRHLSLRLRYRPDDDPPHARRRLAGLEGPLGCVSRFLPHTVGRSDDEDDLQPLVRKNGRHVWPPRRRELGDSCGLRSPCVSCRHLDNDAILQRRNTVTSRISSLLAVHVVATRGVTSSWPPLRKLIGSRQVACTGILRSSTPPPDRCMIRSVTRLRLSCISDRLTANARRAIR